MTQRVGDRSVGALVRERANQAVPICEPGDTIRAAAQLMSATHRRFVVASLPGGQWGICTDGDVRRRVVAQGRSTELSVGEILTAPARTVSEAIPAVDALREMLAAGIKQLPVLDSAGHCVGVVEDTELFGAPTRSGFVLRAAVARADSADALISACSKLPGLIVSLTDAKVAPFDVAAIGSIVIEAAVTRAIDIAAPDHRDLTWFTSGSIGRREALPASDIETAMVIGTPDDPTVATSTADAVHRLLDRAGLQRDPNNAVAAQRRFARTEPQWRDAILQWVADPMTDNAIVMLALLGDARCVAGQPIDLARLVTEALRTDSRACSLMLEAATSEIFRLPNRDKFFRRIESVDLKAALVSPITRIARWAAVIADCPDLDTTQRLTAAGDRGVLPADQATVLRESFEVVQRIRLRHQCDRITAGMAPNDSVTFDELSPLSRSLIASAIREVAGVQRTLRFLDSTTMPVPRS